MKVTLAGATLDRRFWKDDPAATPETTSAAYARISHSPKSIDRLRDIAVEEVEGARRSNENIIYKMGHSSIAEHAVFNIDIEDASRLLVEFIEHHRLASFTERSQRYVYFGNKDLGVPPGLEGTDFQESVEKLERDKLDLYNRMVSSDDLKESYGDRLLEQARYVLGLTCPTDVGFTVNARELEHIISRGKAHPLQEVRDFSDSVLEETSSLVPSLIKHTDGDHFVHRANDGMMQWMNDNLESFRKDETVGEGPHEKRVTVCSCRPVSCDDPETEIAAALLYQMTDMDLASSRRTAMEMTDEDLLDLFRPIFSEYPVHASLPRAFEMMDLTFDFDISASGFAQLKRHRMATLLVKDYQPFKWHTPPVYVEDPELAREYVSLMRRSGKLYERISSNIDPHAAQYVLTNAHIRNVVFKLNLRELYHFVRLRSDMHAQDEIRNISDMMVNVLKRHFPIVTAMLCGKDSHDQGRKRILGCDSISQHEGG